MEPEGRTDWTDQLRNLAIVAVQLASLLVIAEHFHWSLSDWLRGQLARYRRWLRQQEFEIFYQYVWPQRQHEEAE